MIFHRLGLINRNQMGFTLMELLIAIAISGVITGGITMTVFQVVTGNFRASNHMTAVRQVQDAGFSVSRNAQMAQSVTLGASSGFPLTLSWTDWDTNNVHRVVYTLEDIPGSEVKNLQRSHSINGGTPEASIIAQFIDWNINPALTKTKCELGGIFTLPDSGDTFTISGGPVADSGKITVTAGSISVTATGGAKINGTTSWTGGTGASAPWTTPAAAGTVVVAASGAGTAGAWTSTTASATVAITVDTDSDATITGSVLTFTVTATVGSGSEGRSETRVYEAKPRPGSW